jgi:aspartate carbamoyltransferase regulatory subunit
MLNISGIQEGFVLDHIQAGRMKRRTLNTLDIGAAQDMSDALDS